MFEEIINKPELSRVADEFRQLLVKYSANYPEAKNVLERASVLLEQAINQEIESPYRRGFFPEEFWEDSPLFELEDLSDRCAEFSLLLKGAISIESIKREVRDIEKTAEKDEKRLRNKNA